MTNDARVTLEAGTWEPLPGAATTITVADTPITALIAFSASVACFGLDRDKYARIVIDGAVRASVPLATIPPTTQAQSEIPVMLQTSSVLSSPGTHTIAVQALVAGNSYCVITPGLWHLAVHAYR